MGRQRAPGDGDRGVALEPAPLSEAQRTPFVSAVIPVYNRATLLPRAIESVLAQTFQDFEIVVVDDASTEDVRAVCEAAGDPRIRYVRRDTNGRVGAARNTGIEAARGVWVAFLDSDDEWLPEKLERQLACAEAADAAVVQSWCLIEEDGVRRVPSQSPLARGDGWDGLLTRGRARTPSAFLIRSDAARAVGGFDEKLPFGEDWDFLYRLAQYGYQFAGVEEGLVVHHHHDEGRMSNDAFARLAGFHVTDRIWRDEVRARRGVDGYRTWRRRRFRYVKREHKRHVHAIIASSDRMAALCYVMRVLPSLWPLRRQARLALLFALTGRGERQKD